MLFVPGDILHYNQTLPTCSKHPCCRQVRVFGNWIFPCKRPRFSVWLCIETWVNALLWMGYLNLNRGDCLCPTPEFAWRDPLLDMGCREVWTTFQNWKTGALVCTSCLHSWIWLNWVRCPGLAVIEDDGEDGSIREYQEKRAIHKMKHKLIVRGWSRSYHSRRYENDAGCTESLRCSILAMTDDNSSDGHLTVLQSVKIQTVRAVTSSHWAKGGSYATRRHLRSWPMSAVCLQGVKLL